MHNLKQQLYILCTNYISATIKNAEQLIEDARVEYSSDTKSCACD
jgi:hypothetical protein